jgi:hypothetical protein
MPMYEVARVIDGRQAPAAVSAIKRPFEEIPQCRDGGVGNASDEDDDPQVRAEDSHDYVQRLRTA